MKREWERLTCFWRSRGGLQLGDFVLVCVWLPPSVFLLFRWWWRSRLAAWVLPFSDLQGGIEETVMLMLVFLGFFVCVFSFFFCVFSFSLFCWVSSLCLALVWKIIQVLCFLNSLYSLPVCFCFRCFKAGIGKGRVYFWYGVLKKHLKIRLVSLGFSLLVSFVPSPPNQPAPLLFGAARFI